MKIDQQMRIYVLAGILISFGFGSAQAQNITAFGESFQLCIVDMQGLVDKSNAGVAVGNKLEEEAKQKGMALKQRKEQLEADAKQIEAQRSVLDKTVFDKKVRDFEVQYTEWQKDASMAQQDFLNKKMKAFEPVYEHMYKSLNDVAKTKGCKLVLHMNAVVGMDPELGKKIDITKEVMTVANQTKVTPAGKTEKKEKAGKTP